MLQTTKRLLTIALLAAATAVPATSEAYRVDPDSSWVVAVTGKAGAFGFLGHQHAILVTDSEAQVDWRPEAPVSSRARVTVPVANLKIDTQRGRELAGLDKGPDADDVAKLQTKMMDAEHLSAEQHPQIVLAITSVAAPKTGLLTMDGALTLHGVTKNVRFPVAIAELSGGGIRFSGDFTIKQTDFGIEPESVGGVVNVADAVSIRFQMTLRRQ